MKRSSVISNNEKKSKSELLADRRPALTQNGGYGWVVVFASMMCNMIADGVLYAYSVLKIPLDEHFKVGEGMIMLPGSVAVGVYMLCGPVYSRLSEKYGCRAVVMVGALLGCISLVLSAFSMNVYTFLVLYGILAGFGLGLIYLPSILMLKYYFDTKLSLATGIVVSGSGIGVLSFGQLTGILCDYYGWRGGLVFLSGIILNCAVFGALMKMPAKKKIITKAPQEMNSHSNGRYESVPIEDGVEIISSKSGKRSCATFANSLMRFDLLCDPTVATLGMAQVFGFFGYLLVVLLLVTVAEKDIKATPIQARMTMTVLGITNTVGRFFFGWLPGPRTCTMGTINWVTLLITSISCFMFPLFKTYTHIMLFSVVFGLFTAPYVGLTPTVIYDAVGEGVYGDVLGIAFFFRGLSSLVGPSFGGYLADVTGSYKLTFVVAASALAISTVLHFLAPWANKIKLGPCHNRIN